MTYTVTKLFMIDFHSDNIQHLFFEQYTFPAASVLSFPFVPTLSLPLWQPFQVEISKKGDKKKSKQDICSGESKCLKSKPKDNNRFPYM